MSPISSDNFISLYLSLVTQCSASRFYQTLHSFLFRSRFSGPFVQTESFVCAILAELCISQLEHFFVANDSHEETREHDPLYSNRERAIEGIWVFSYGPRRSSISTPIPRFAVVGK